MEVINRQCNDSALISLKGRTYEYQREESNSSCNGKTGLRNDQRDVQ